MATTISKNAIRRFFKSSIHRLDRWHVVFDNDREGRLVDADNGTVYYWDIDPNGWLCVCSTATWEGAGPLCAYAKLDAKRPRWHYL